MPKAGTEDLPTKANERLKKKDKLTETDPSTWPESKIPTNEKITAGDIKKYYHLTPALYSGLSHSSFRTSQGFTTHLYNEQEVERAAWMKYGGPEAYQTHLERLRQSQATRNPRKSFLTPSLRKKSGGRTTFGVGSISDDTGNWGLGPTYTWKLDLLPPVLQAIKDHFPAEWLWKKCNEALDPPDCYSLDMILSERAKALSWAVERMSPGALTAYPPRPPGYLASSESVDKLRAILAEAPRVPEYGNGEDEYDGMVRHESWHPEWDVSYDWNNDYYDKVCQALVDVVKQTWCW